MDYHKLGNNIRKLRMNLKLTQRQIADKCGLSLDFIGNIERGERKASVEALKKIAKSLDVSVECLLDDPKDLNEADINNELDSLISKCTLQEKEKIVKMIKLIFSHL